MVKYFISYELDDIDLLVNRFAKFGNQFLESDDLGEMVENFKSE